MALWPEYRVLGKVGASQVSKEEIMLIPVGVRIMLYMTMHIDQLADFKFKKEKHMYLYVNFNFVNSRGSAKIETVNLNFKPISLSMCMHVYSHV